MGNNLGELANSCGATEAFGFENTTRAVITAHSIEPWPCRDLIRYNLQKQAALARDHAFKDIPVRDGVLWFKNSVGGRFQHLTRDVFVEEGCTLLQQSGVRHGQKDRNELYDIFDAMDFDENGELSVGEWAGGCTVFFNGTQIDCVTAAFEALDTNGDCTLDKSELVEYLKPFVNAMTPPEANALRPLLLKRASDIIFDEMDVDHDTRITSEEMVQWSQEPGNNIVNRVANIIEHEVYSTWLREQDKQNRMAYGRREQIDARYDNRYDNSRGQGQYDDYYGGKGQGKGRGSFSSPPYDNSGNDRRYDSPRGSAYNSRNSSPAGNRPPEPQKKIGTKWSDIIPGVGKRNRRRDMPTRGDYRGSAPDPRHDRYYGGTYPYGGGSPDDFRGIYSGGY